MRAFQLAAIMVASFDAAASDSAFTLTGARVEPIDSSCFMKCDDVMRTARDVKKCLDSITVSKTADCTSATVTLDYETKEISDCSASTTTTASTTGSTTTVSTPTPTTPTSTTPKAPRPLKKGNLHFAVNAIDDAASETSIQIPLKGLFEEVNLITAIQDSDIKIVNVTLGHRGSDQCKNPTVHNTTAETICGSKGTSVSMDASAVTTNIKLTAKDPIVLGKSTGLLAQWNDAGCILTALSPPATQSIEVQATVTIDPSPITIIGAVKFNDGCFVEGCEGAITTPKQAQSCLTGAAADTKCETANYTRTLTNARTVQCSTKHPVQLTMSLAEIFEDETDVTSKADSTIMKDVYFGKSAGPDCGEAKIYLTDGCVATGEGELTMTKDSEKLHFTGEVPLDEAAQQESLLVAFKDEAGKCTVSKDLKGDTITLESSFTIAHDAPSSVSSLTRVSISALVMAVSSIAFVEL